MTKGMGRDEDVVDVGAREGYDRWAPTYDVKTNALVELDSEVLGRHLERIGSGLTGKRALDLGCGTGRNSLRLMQLGAHVTGVDFSEGMLRIGADKSGSDQIRFVVHDLTRPLPFPDASFDVIVCTLVLEHVERLEPVFTEIARVCSPGAWVHVSDIHPELRRRGGRAQFSDRVRGEEVRPQGYHHAISEYVMGMVDAGLTIVRMEELVGTEALAQRAPKMAPHVGLPMLLAVLSRA